MIPDAPNETGSDQVAEVQTLTQEFETGCAFGPTFFVAQLGRLVRERCPDPQEGVPSVQLYLLDGERLDLCHVIGFASRWVALAVWESGLDGMRTELVPFADFSDPVGLIAAGERAAETTLPQIEGVLERHRSLFVRAERKGGHDARGA